MAQKIDYAKAFNDLTKYVPRELRNPVNVGLLDNLFNRFMTRDEGIPLFGFVGRRPTSAEDKSPRIAQTSPERDINAIIPVLNFDVGAEKYAFTVQDLLNKARALGIDTNDLGWLYSQANVFAPPIDFDKFTNFFNYYWVAKAVPTAPVLEWNSELLPEYYVIAKPEPGDLDKLNVKVATAAGNIVLTGAGFNNHTFTVTFTTPTTFTVTVSEATIAGPNGTYVPVTSTFTLSALPTIPPLTPIDSVSPVVDVITFSVVGPDGTFQLVRFDVTRNPLADGINNFSSFTGFQAGDIFSIETAYLSPNYNVLFTGVTPPVRGTIGAVQALNDYQSIDGVVVGEGDRVLVKNQAVPNQNGIYVVQPGGWTRAEDFNTETWSAGARTFVLQGTTNSQTLWTSSGVTPSFTWTNTPPNVNNSNDWQEGNFWVKGDELEALGVDRAAVIQATRPIIEFNAKLQLNTRITVDDLPSDVGIEFKQEKTEFNQLPLFDLYRYDGTHTNTVSSIFYYVEDLTADLDLALQKRVKLADNGSGDFIFNHGCTASDGNLLFFKMDGELKTVWQAGYMGAEAVDFVLQGTLIEQLGSMTFTGVGNGAVDSLVPGVGTAQTITITFTSSTTFDVTASIDGALSSGSVGIPFISDLVNFTVNNGSTAFTTGSQFTFVLDLPGSISAIVPQPQTQQQLWYVVADSATTFSVSASKMPTIPAPFNTASVGTPYSNGDISFVINATTPAGFTPGDTFIIRIGNVERPRYVFRESDDSIQDLYGGKPADVNNIGAYLVSRTFYNNPYNISRDEITEGSLNGHFRGIIAAQPEGLPQNNAFGGSIILWSEQHTLLASLLMQRDLTPISMIDMAKRQYENGINVLRDIYMQQILQYFSSNSVVLADSTPAGTAQVNSLLDWVLELRAQDLDSRTVLYDTTAAVVGFPATLPQLGLAELVEPSIVFDRVLGQNVLVHHDGHLSSIAADTQEFRDELFGNYISKNILRSDGTETPAIGSFTNVPPSTPYKGEIWYRPMGAGISEIMVFDIDIDAPVLPAVEPPLVFSDVYPAGVLCYVRGTNTIYQSSGTGWTLTAIDPLTRWVKVDLAAALNEMLLITEERLYNGINPTQRRYDFTPLLSDSTFQQELQRELSTFAALNGLDPLGTNYSSADAFTWNYSQALVANFAPLTTATVPARWYNALTSHQSTVPGVLATERPDVEPWKLLGYSSYSTWWSSLTPVQQAAYTPFAVPPELTDGTFTAAGYVRAVKTVAGTTVLSGLQVIDGVSLQNGDLVLLQNELSPANNGIWKVSTGTWTRQGTLLLKMYVTVTEGTRYAGTQWALTAQVVNVNTDPVNFAQVRYWTEQLWADILSAKPALRTSVNPWTGNLIPPYVNAGSPLILYALTTVIPSGVASPFEFGEGSPVEEVWQRSIEYGYALAKALARYDPLALLGFSWGFNWVEVDNILYDGFDVNMPGHQRFRLHGEAVPAIDRTGAIQLTSTTAASDITITITYDAYDVNRKQSFSIRNAETGELLGTTVEGVTTTLALAGITLTNLTIDDLGRPFRIGDQFRVAALAGTTSPVPSFVPVTVHRILGLGQTFTNALRYVSVDQQSGFAIQAFREWDVNMGYRAGGLVATDDLNIFTEAATLNQSSYELIIKRNPIAKDMWLQALRVTVLQYGEFGEDPPNGIGPSYRGTVNGIPAGAGDDWVYRVEGYNPRNTVISYYDLQGIQSGVAFPSTAPIGQTFFRHDLGQSYVFDGSTWNPTDVDGITTFNVLDKTVTDLTWYKPTIVNSTVDTFLPVTITGTQNLVNFLYGYAQHSHDQGWRFNTANEFNIDAETGRHRNWQLDIEKLLDRLYRGISEGQGHVINPFVDRVWVQQDTGLLAEFVDTSLFDITGDAGVFDVLGVRFKTADLRPLRTNLISSIAAVAPMYSVHAQLDEFEHLFIFADFVDTTTQTGLLYDAFSGSRTVTYKFNGRRQGNETFRTEFGGHYIVGNEVRQNVQASTDTLEQVYDANAVFENTTTSKHALALLGFSTKDYFGNLDISDKTQFNFWRGLIQAKGTNMSIDAYLNSDRFQQADIDEYWAYKLAEYGDSRQLSFPEMHIEVEDSLQQFTLLQFDAAIGDELVNFTQINRFDESRWFSIDDLDQDAYFKAEPAGAYAKEVTTGDLITLPFIADKLVFDPLLLTQVNATSLIAIADGTATVQGFGPATPRYSPIKLFNFVDAQLIEQIPHWHPAIGQHTPTAMENINVISDIDPARYNYSTLVQGNNSYDPLRPWADREVGRIWFDTRNLEYVPYYDTTIFPDRAEQLSRWGAIADYASIDVYEWVKSSVPPAEYAALASVEALDADITSQSKASGDVALQSTYERQRVWSIRPVAWSQTGTVFGGHPAFNGSFESPLYIAGTVYSLDAGTFAQLGITAGMRIGAWDPSTVAPKAVSEAVIDSFVKDIQFNGSAFPGSGIATAVGVPSVVSVAYVEHTTQTGQLIFSAEPVIAEPRLDVDSIVVGYDFVIDIRVSDVDTGEQFVFNVNTAFNTTPSLPNEPLGAGDTFTFEITPFGLSVSVEVTAGGSYAADALQAAIVAALNTGVSTRDAANVVVIADNRSTSGMLIPDTLDNDPVTITSINNQGIGWRAWSVPSQAQLDADGKQPKSIWKPYPGEYANFSPSEQQLADAIAYQQSPLTLNDDTVVDRYSTEWTDWQQLKDTVFTATAAVAGPVTFVHTENIDPIRTTVYKNGIAQLAAAYVIVGTDITLSNVEAGSIVRVIIRHYNPTQEELAFDPDTQDDLTYQEQFKQDYEYVAFQTRDSEGALSQTSYYFWVRNRTVASQTKKLSVQAIAQELRDGPPAYMTFQNILDSTVSLPYRYDAISISGLSFLVTKNDTFKLRFTRNFTLRANEVDVFGSELKNVHTEWGLIRPKQKTRIPEALWLKLIDSMAGEDAAGNSVPALRRTLYDERTGDTTQFGFGAEQTLAPSQLLRSSVLYTILNTRLVDKSGVTPVPDFILALDFSMSDSWFATPTSTRETMTLIWTEAKVSQINEIFFAALEDILASNLQLTDIFKTSRLSAYSVRTVVPGVSVPTYD